MFANAYKSVVGSNPTHRTQVANNCNLNKWNEITIVLLESDLKLLKQHLMKSADYALQKLSNNEKDIKAYNTLMESIYCRVILLNRKRPEELQRMFLATYVNDDNNKQSYEEFHQAISPTEKILLLNNLKHVIGGKRGRGAPVLFSSGIQMHIKKLLEIRSNFVSSGNLYLFGRAHLMTSISGYKVLEKHAKSCGVKH